MSLILSLHAFFTIIFLYALPVCTRSLPEEAFYGYPLQADEDYLYVDTRSDPHNSEQSGSFAFKSSETRRRSILNNNFARFGRNGPKTKLLSANADPEIKDVMYPKDEDIEPYGRNLRSGERSDQFIRFGRGKSDFVRFGRADGGYQRNRDFIRFGRSTRSVKNQKKPTTQDENINKKDNHTIRKVTSLVTSKKLGKEWNKLTTRNKRSASSTDLEVYKKGGSNFVRFGRDRNDNFMRFGRMMNSNHKQSPILGNLAEIINPALINSDASKTYNNTLELQKYRKKQEQQRHDLVLKMLIDILTRSHLHEEIQEMQLLRQLQNSLENQSLNKQQCY